MVLDKEINNANYLYINSTMGVINDGTAGWESQVYAPKPSL